MSRKIDTEIRAKAKDSNWILIWDLDWMIWRLKVRPQKGELRFFERMEEFRQEKDLLRHWIRELLTSLLKDWFINILASSWDHDYVLSSISRVRLNDRFLLTYWNEFTWKNNSKSYAYIINKIWFDTWEDLKRILIIWNSSFDQSVDIWDMVHLLHSEASQEHAKSTWDIIKILTADWPNNFIQAFNKLHANWWKDIDKKISDKNIGDTKSISMDNWSILHLWFKRHPISWVSSYIINVAKWCGTIWMEEV